MLGPGGFRMPVALKVLHTGADAIRREARIGGLLRHRNLVDVYEIDEVEGQWFCALELCQGSLADLIPLPPRAVVEVGIQVCAALDYAHKELGLVHLDIKPANLLYRDGVVKVADLGIARADGFATDERVRGTLAYMPPEQRFGLEVDARADVFALGRTLLELCTGYGEAASETLDFSGELSADVTLVLEDQVATHGSAVGVTTAPAWLAPVLERCTALNKDHRWPDMAALGAALADLRLDGPGLADALGLTSTAHESGPRRETNVVEPEDRFVGREDELAALAELLATPSIITLKGPAGIGKSRLALHAAARWHTEHGGQVWRCDLTEVRSAEGLLNALSTVLDMALGKGSLDAQIDRVGHALASRGPLVLVLDTFEQILKLAPILARWSARATDARFVITSRAPLKLAEERRLEVGPLSSRWAVSLLTDRAQRRGADIRYDPDLVLLAERLDGVPLALELAAGRLGVLSVAELLERFSLSLLRRGTAGRHGTIEAALDTSWAMLTPDESSALSQLSAFSGGFTLEAAEQVVDIEGSILEAVHALAESSMVRAHRDGRFGLLSSVQDFAHARLGEPSVMRRHAQWYAGKGSAQTVDDLDRHGGIEKRRALTAELGNLITACERACDGGWLELAERTLFAAWEVLSWIGPFGLGVELLDRVSALDGPKSVTFHLYAARIQNSVGDNEGASEHHARALALAHGRPIAARVALDRGQFQREVGRSDVAASTLERAIAAFRDQGDRLSEARGLGTLALLYTEQGRFDEARETFPMALAAHRDVGNRRGEGAALGNHGSLLVTMGDLEGALATLQKCLAITRETGNRKSEALWLGNMGILERRLGRPESAESYYRQSLAVNREIGFRRSEGFNLGNLGSLAQSAGRLEESRRFSEQALAIHLEVGNLRSAAMVHGNLGLTELKAGNIRAARTHLGEAFTGTQKLRDHRRLPLWMALLARCDAADGEFNEGMLRLERARTAAADVLEPALVVTLETTHAELAWGLGRQDEARAAYQRAEAAGRPDDVDVIAELTRVRKLMAL